MPATSFREYVRALAAALDRASPPGEVAKISLEVDERSPVRGLIFGRVAFQDGSELHFREFLDLGAPSPKLMYAYHFQDRGGTLVFRYDNAAHRPRLPDQSTGTTRPASIPPELPPWRTWSRRPWTTWHAEGAAKRSSEA